MICKKLSNILVDIISQKDFNKINKDTYFVSINNASEDKLVILLDLLSKKFNLAKSGNDYTEMRNNKEVYRKEIPKIIHQTWKTKDLPQNYKKWSNSIKKMHPDWTYILWTDEMKSRFY